jgi:hypothetical protein
MINSISCIIFILLFLIFLIKIRKYYVKEYFSNSDDDLVFIITRYVKDDITNKYWIKSYNSIRKIYPTTKIIIIDDNSPYKDNSYNSKLTNCKIVKSEYPQRGELLPYYYFHKNKYAKKAVIVHDSVFINKKINIDNIDTYRFLWDFNDKWSNTKLLHNILNLFQDEKLMTIYKTQLKWIGCFGGMTVITWDFIDKINTQCNFFNKLLPVITDREHRMAFERIIGCMCVYNDKLHKPLFGDIHRWIRRIQHTEFKSDSSWGITYEEYIKYKQYFESQPIIKIWSGR